MHVFSTGPVILHDSLNKIDYRFLIWQNVDLNKIVIDIAYKQFLKIFSYINKFQKLKPPYWVIT